MGIPQIHQLLRCQRTVDRTVDAGAAKHGGQTAELGTLELPACRFDRTGFCRIGSLGRGGSKAVPLQDCDWDCNP